MRGDFATERTVFIIGCIALALSLPFSVIMEILIGTLGHDFTVYCDASVSFLNGENPYYIANLPRSSLPFVYPPTTLPIFVIACAPTTALGLIPVYFIYYSVALLLTIYAVQAAEKFTLEPSQVAYLIALTAAGYIGAYYNFATGNIGIIGALAIAILYYGIESDREWLGVTSISILSILKVFPAVFGVAQAFSTLDKKVAARILLSYATIGIGATGVSAILFPTLTRTYVLAITGQLQQQSPTAETSGIPFLLSDAGEYVTQSPVIGYALALFVTVVLLGTVFILVREDRLPRLHRLSLAIIGFLLILPRLQPYTLSLAVVPTYYLTREWNLRRKAVIILLAVTIPSAGRVSRLLLNSKFEGVLPPLLQPINHLQTVSLALVFVYSAALSWKSLSEPHHD